MFAISLTSIPPRFSQLPRVVAALRAQHRRPDKIFLSIPRTYRRFGAVPTVPNLEGVEVLRPETDHGPACKVLGALRHLSPQDDLIYCDDDWEYGPTWADELFGARPNENTIVSAAPFDLSRLKRQGNQIVQGFAGVLLKPAMIPPEAFTIPEVAWAVDDIWLSGHYARQIIPICAAPQARKACTPLEDPANLQSASADGKSRASANQACAAYIHQKFGIWPPLTTA